MLLIRPYMRLNKGRLKAYHIIFFIFIVSNVGGCLTPIGDPPLFLGYLKGIPFWWVAEHCWPMWAVGVGFLLSAHRRRTYCWGSRRDQSNGCSSATGWWRRRSMRRTPSGRCRRG